MMTFLALWIGGAVFTALFLLVWSHLQTLEHDKMFEKADLEPLFWICLIWPGTWLLIIGLLFVGRSSKSS